MGMKPPRLSLGETAFVHRLTELLDQHGSLLVNVEEGKSPVETGAVRVDYKVNAQGNLVIGIIVHKLRVD
jgi:hypothetical protein